MEWNRDSEAGLSGFPSCARETSSRWKTGRRGTPNTSWGCAGGRRAGPQAARRRAAGTRAALDHRGREGDGENAGFQEPANLATELYLDELDESVADDLRDRLAALKRAEQRLAGGTYGLTVESGRPIPDERLEIFPAAERTVEEERALDERGAS
jgi:DnaK suppressor protein